MRARSRQTFRPGFDVLNRENLNSFGALAPEGNTQFIDLGKEPGSLRRSRFDECVDEVRLVRIKKVRASAAGLIAMESDRLGHPRIYNSALRDGQRQAR
jgi:hypothetical protein